jgi:hypothetical protein
VLAHVLVPPVQKACAEEAEEPVNVEPEPHRKLAHHGDHRRLEARASPTGDLQADRDRSQLRLRQGNCTGEHDLVRVEDRPREIYSECGPGDLGIRRGVPSRAADM